MTTSSNTSPVKIFIAYSRKDEQYLEELRKHFAPLERNQSVEIWYDGEILAGNDWEENIKRHLNNADIILLLVSANSLASDYFYSKEMNTALARHKQKEAIVVPIILSDCVWESTNLKNLQVLPKNGEPVSEWANPSKAYANIVRGLNKNVQNIQKKRQKKKPSPPINTKQNPSNFPTRFAAIGMLGLLLGLLLIFGLSQIRNPPFEEPDPINRDVAKHVESTKLDSSQKESKTPLSEEQLPKPRMGSGLEKTDPNQPQKTEPTTKEKKAEKNTQEYNHLLKLANNEYNQQRWTKAKDYYEQAAKYKNTQLVQDSIGVINWRLKQEKEKNTTSNVHPEIQKLIRDMVKVEGGTFEMGSNDGGEDEKPVHSVTLKNFYIGKYEVTQAQWRAVMGSDPKGLKFKGCNNCPVENVSWDDIQDFLKELNQRTGRTFRLPSEAQWEYAARGGKKSKGYTYSGSNNLDEVAWYRSNSDSKTHPVGTTQKANELGAYDMSGNVWEWCQDCGNKNYNNAPKDGSAWTSGNCDIRVVRGGSWYNVIDGGCRVSIRLRYDSYDRLSYVGFRLSRY